LVIFLELAQVPHATLDGRALVPGLDLAGDDLGLLAGLDKAFLDAGQRGRGFIVQLGERLGRPVGVVELAVP
jgi:hypothetical protein